MLSCSDTRCILISHSWLNSIIILIIINFYGAYVLRNLNSEAQQTRIIKRNREQGRAKVIIRKRDRQRFRGNTILNKYVLSFLEGSYSFRCFLSDGEFILARFPKLRLVLGTISCCEMDDLSCLEIFESCRRLAK